MLYRMMSQLQELLCIFPHTSQSPHDDCPIFHSILPTSALQIRDDSSHQQAWVMPKPSTSPQSLPNSLQMVYESDNLFASTAYSFVCVERSVIRKYTQVRTEHSSGIHGQVKRE